MDIVKFVKTVSEEKAFHVIKVGFASVDESRAVAMLLKQLRQGEKITLRAR